jgi:hypothetical protein
MINKLSSQKIEESDEKSGRNFRIWKKINRALKINKTLISLIKLCLKHNLKINKT